ncbi:MAG: CapA family protein, partial [Muribaculaceae bacterium]|nr:CapA family protein [Muribaculaceae bacterium]
MVLLPLITLLGLLFGAYDAEIVFAGDAMQHQVQLDHAKRPGGEWDYSGYFDSGAPWFHTADLAVVNLETPIGKAPHTGYPCFNAPDAFVDALHKAGFGLFLTANNHCLDRHDRGTKSTIDALDTRRLPHLGTYHDTAARDTLMPHVRTVNGINVSFINYTYGTNGIKPGNTHIDYIDRERIAADIKEARDAGAEIICACMHWGDEYHMLPNAGQKALADWLQEQGVQLIIGSHPHVIQPMELRTNPDGSHCLVVYSLGNFISAMRTRDTRGGAVVGVHLERKLDGSVDVSDAYYKLHFTAPAYGRLNFRVVDAYKRTDPRAAA